MADSKGLVKRIFDTIGTVISGAYLLIMVVGAAGVAGVVGMVVVWLTSGFTGLLPWNDFTMSLGFIIPAAVVVGVALYFGVIEPAKKRALQEAADRRRDESRRQEAEANRLRNMEHAAWMILANAGEAVTSFETIPGALDRAETSTQQAGRFFADGAFSPFWSMVEAAYGALADTRQAAVDIESRSKRHVELVDRFATIGGNPTQISTFPIELDPAPLLDVARKGTEQLGALVYEAQKHPTFAQIWEQRRTTAAVIAGFHNLEQAVRGMSGALAASIYSMGESLTDSHARVERAVVGVSHSVAGASTAQVEAMQSLGQKADGIRGEVYRQTWGNYPLF